MRIHKIFLTHLKRWKDCTT